MQQGQQRRILRPIALELITFISRLDKAIQEGVATTLKVLEEATDTRRRIASIVEADCRPETVLRVWNDHPLRVFKYGLGGPLSSLAGRTLLEMAYSHPELSLLDRGTRNLKRDIRLELSEIAEPHRRFDFLQQRVIQLTYPCVETVTDIPDGSPMSYVISEWEEYLDLNRLLYCVYKGVELPRSHDVTRNVLGRGKRGGVGKIYHYGVVHSQVIAEHDIDASGKDAVHSFGHSDFLQEHPKQHSGIIPAEHRIWVECPTSCFSPASVKSSPHFFIWEANPEWTFEEFSNKHPQYFLYRSSQWALYGTGLHDMQVWPARGLNDTEDPLTGVKLGDVRFSGEPVGCPAIPGNGISSLIKLYSYLYADPLLIPYSLEWWRNQVDRSHLQLRKIDPGPREELPAINHVLAPHGRGPESNPERLAMPR